MLIGIRHALSPGEHVPLTSIFEKSSRETTGVRVEKDPRHEDGRVAAMPAHRAPRRRRGECG